MLTFNHRATQQFRAKHRIRKPALNLNHHRRIKNSSSPPSVAAKSPKPPSCSRPPRSASASPSPGAKAIRYDFIVDCGGHIWRVQVKSAHSSAINGYSFHACGNVHSRRYTPRDIDFIVGYVVPDNAWYVIPIEVFAERTGVKVFPSSKRRMSRYEKYREAWDYMRNPDSALDNIDK
jgi:hypothetical protein